MAAGHKKKRRLSRIGYLCIGLAITLVLMLALIGIKVILGGTEARPGLIQKLREQDLTETLGHTPNENEMLVGEIEVADYEQLADLTGYQSYSDSVTYVLYDIDTADLAEKMAEKKTFCLYVGYDDCEWCIEAMPILNNEAKAHGMVIEYLDCKKMVNDDLDALKSMVGVAMEKGNNGEPTLFTPLVVFIKNGEIVYSHTGTVDAHNAHERMMNDQECAELHKIYAKGFDRLRIE